MNKANGEIVSLRAHLNELPPPPAPTPTIAPLNNSINYNNNEVNANSYSKSSKSASNSGKEEASVAASSTHNTNNTNNSSSGSSDTIPAAAHLYTPNTPSDVHPGTTSEPPVCGISETNPGDGPNQGLNQGPNQGLRGDLTTARDEVQRKPAEEEADMPYWKEISSEGTSYDGQGDSAGVDRDIELKRKRAERGRAEGQSDGRNEGRSTPPQDTERERESEGDVCRAQKVRLGGREGSGKRMSLTRAIEVMRPAESSASAAKGECSACKAACYDNDVNCQHIEQITTTATR